MTRVVFLMKKIKVNKIESRAKTRMKWFPNQNWQHEAWCFVLAHCAVVSSAVVKSHWGYLPHFYNWKLPCRWCCCSEQSRHRSVCGWSCCSEPDILHHIKHIRSFHFLPLSCVSETNIVQAWRFILTGHIIPRRKKWTKINWFILLLL